MSTYEKIDYAVKGSVAYVTLWRPEVENRIDAAMLSELADACQSIADNEQLRVAVFGALGPAFSLGFDDDLLSAAPSEGAPGLSAVGNLAIPTIAAINGDAIGAGLELALCCDFRIAADGATFALPDAALGRIPSSGGTQRLPRIVGKGNALDLLLTGRNIDAAEAHRMDLVERVVPMAELAAAVDSLAQLLASRAPIAVRYAKEVVRRGAEMTLEQGLRFEMDLNVLLQTTRDRAEGIKAFLEKRPPVFTGE